jgi:hypothetical protein
VENGPGGVVGCEQPQLGLERLHMSAELGECGAMHDLVRDGRVRLRDATDVQSPWDERFCGFEIPGSNREVRFLAQHEPELGGLSEFISKQGGLA